MNKFNTARTSISDEENRFGKNSLKIKKNRQKMIREREGSYEDKNIQTFTKKINVLEEKTKEMA